MLNLVVEPGIERFQSNLPKEHCNYFSNIQNVCSSKKYVDKSGRLFSYNAIIVFQRNIVLLKKNHTEARGQLSDTSSYPTLDHDPTDKHYRLDHPIAGYFPSNFIVPQLHNACFYLLHKFNMHYFPGSRIVSAAPAPLYTPYS